MFISPYPIYCLMDERVYRSKPESARGVRKGGDFLRRTTDEAGGGPRKERREGQETVYDDVLIQLQPTPAMIPKTRLIARG